LNDFTNQSTAHTFIHGIKKYTFNNIYYVLAQSSPDVINLKVKQPLIKYNILHGE